MHHNIFLVLIEEDMISQRIPENKYIWILKCINFMLLIHQILHDFEGQKNEFTRIYLYSFMSKIRVDIFQIILTKDNSK